MGHSAFFEGGKSTLQAVIPLGTSAVTTTTKIVGVVPKKLRVKGVRFYGQAQVTGTSLTAEVHARTLAGGSGASLQSAATSIAFASATAAKAGVAASLTSTEANLYLSPGQLIEVVVTATSVSAGPGDLLVALETEPRV